VMHIAFLSPSTIEFEADEQCRWDEPSAINDDSIRSGQANVYGVNTRRYHQIKNLKKGRANVDGRNPRRHNDIEFEADSTQPQTSMLQTMQARARRLKPKGDMRSATDVAPPGAMGTPTDVAPAPTGASEPHHVPP
jgi:hypothetical protein